MNKVNKTTEILVSAVVPALGSGNDTAYLWDLIEPVQRFLLLNQTSIAATLSWNVTQQLQQNLTDLSWATIPSNVQLFLQQELLLNQFSNLTFFSWGWTDSNNTFASTTLISLLTSQGQQNLPIIQSILAPLTFSTILNTTVLTQGHRRARPNHQVRELFEDIQKALPFAPFKEPPNHDHHHYHHRLPTPYDVIDAAWHQAVKIVWTFAGSNSISQD